MYDLQRSTSESPEPCPRIDDIRKPAHSLLRSNLYNCTSHSEASSQSDPHHWYIFSRAEYWFLYGGAGQPWATVRRTRRMESQEYSRSRRERPLPKACCIEGSMLNRRCAGRPAAISFLSSSPQLSHLIAGESRLIYISNGV